MSEFSWSIDSLLVRDNVLFGFGWIFHRSQEIKQIRFRLSSSTSGIPEYIAADSGKPREDVKYIFPDYQRALNSGFVVFGAFRINSLEEVLLEALLEDGTVVALDVPKSSIIWFNDQRPGSRHRLFKQQLMVFIRRGLLLIRTRKFGSLFEKIRRYAKSRPKTTLRQPKELASLLKKGENQNLCLIVDHDLGGGANHYRDRMVEMILKEGRGVIILTYHVATLTNMIIVKNDRINFRFAIPNREFILNAVKFLSVADIIYNTAVSFAQPEDIPQLLVGIRHRTASKLKVLVHDFFLVCPSHFLLNWEGQHCGIPDVKVCESCLSKNRQGFATLFVDRDIAKWRALWGSMLATSDEIVTFSGNTAQLLCKGYPQLDRTRITILPHKVEYMKGKAVQLSQTKHLHIGVVGQIGFHKGALFIKALSQEIRRRGSAIKITVIGTIESECEVDVVSQTGPYQHDNLPDMIAASGANIMLFPSVCPETFSYVVQELMNMKLPVASFNIGAPAERLSKYSKGLVLDSMDPGPVLDQLIEFHSKIYLAL